MNLGFFRDSIGVFKAFSVLQTTMFFAFMIITIPALFLYYKKLNTKNNEGLNVWFFSIHFLILIYMMFSLYYVAMALFVATDGFSLLFVGGIPLTVVLIPLIVFKIMVKSTSKFRNKELVNTLLNLAIIEVIVITIFFIILLKL